MLDEREDSIYRYQKHEIRKNISSGAI